MFIEPIIDKDTFYKTRERMEHIKKKHLEAQNLKLMFQISRIIFWYIKQNAPVVEAVY